VAFDDTDEAPPIPRARRAAPPWGGDIERKRYDLIRIPAQRDDTEPRIDAVSIRRPTIRTINPTATVIADVMAAIAERAPITPV
jgi:hypothetical protein